MITNQEVEKLGKLAKLKFTNEEISEFTKQLQNIVEMIDSLKAVNCDNVTPLTSVYDTTQRFRKDEIVTQNNIEELFSNAPGKSMSLAKEVKCFIVPKVIE